jgi:ribonuclease D
MEHSALMISREQLAQLAVARYTGPVRLAETAHDLERAVHSLAHEKVMGFDTETRPSFRAGQSHPVSLVQVAGSHAVFLFQLHRLDCGPALRDLLENPAIVKTGIALADDLAQLRKVFAFTEKNVVDLGRVARQHGIKQSGVRSLAGMFLGWRITKSARTSNWSNHELSPKQITYAATDAWVCRELYIEFQKRGLLEPR